MAPLVITIGMNDETLKSTLSAMASHGRNELTEGFRDAVWREIRHRTALAGEKTTLNAGSLADLLRDLFPRLAMGGLIASVAVAFVVVSIQREEAAATRGMATSKVLNLEVFRSDAQGLAHNGLLAKR